jgi:hypothetical protein
VDTIFCTSASVYLLGIGCGYEYKLGADKETDDSNDTDGKEIAS